MPINNLFVKLILLVWLPHLSKPALGHGNTSYVRDACSVTRYQDICIHYLSPFSNTAKQSPIKWARAGVSVSISEAKSVSLFLVKLKRNGTSMRGRNRGALVDCVECFSDAIDNLHRSLSILRKLDVEAFDAQMEDVTTWLSGAMSNEETCLDGFDGQKRKEVELVRNKVSNVSCVTSNALALVNKLATTGPKIMNDP